MNGPQTAVLDACVLVGSIRRHVLLVFADAGLFQPVWSDKILTETAHAIPKTLPPEAEAKSDHARKVCALLKAAFPDALTPYAERPAFAGLPDPDDMHVISLALDAGAKVIVTENLKDFPPKLLAGHGLSRMNTDAFLAGLVLEHPERAAKAIDRLIRLIDEPQTDHDIIFDRMRRTGLRKTVQALKKADSLPLRQSGAFQFR